MTQLFLLAWRNIWRKKRRSITTIASVTFAILITLSMRSLQTGSYDKMIEAAVKSSGYVQIHAKGYWENKSINDLIEDTPALRSKITSGPNYCTIIPRLQNYALASGDNTSKASIIIGIDPESEDEFNHLSSRIIDGSYLKPNSHGVVISVGLAKFLKLHVDDTLVLIGQGYHATVSASTYVIEGLVELLNPQLNLMTVYMPLYSAQEFNNSPGMVSAYMLNLKEDHDIGNLNQDLQISLGDQFEVMDWKEITPELESNIKIDTTIFSLIALALYVIVGFGVVGTIIMMTLERKKEFGILQSNGMQRRQINLLLLIESIMLGLIGVVVAFCIEMPFITYMQSHPIQLTGDAAKSFEAMGAEPILQMGIKPYLFAMMASIVMGIMIVATLYPMQIIRRMNLSEVIK